MLPPWCSPESPPNPSAGGFPYGLEFLNNTVLAWWFWCLSRRQSAWQEELLIEIALNIYIWWKPSLRSFCSPFPLDYVVKWGLRQPARRWEWRVIIAVDLLGDFSHKWVNSPVTKLLVISSLLSPNFSPDLTPVCIQVLKSIYECEKNRFTFCQKIRKSVADCRCSHLGTLGYGVKPFPLCKPGLIWVICCSRKFPRLVPALPRGTCWS